MTHARKAVPLAILLACWTGIAFAQAGSRQEMRSFQPYAGLQDEPVIPIPPAERGLERKRPEIPTVQRLSPLIEHGVPKAWTAQWYAYCSAKYRSFEPGTGLYTTYSGHKRTCR